ncbi:hypothetical protein PLICRDRAFT_100474 [Plicaturopsis crispa FD-325 SS-3]|nr:hypothetical protein PLICRDRAFT_100474 [Plicaturopsis crispa FD-325 SS-3]
MIIVSDVITWHSSSGQGDVYFANPYSWGKGHPDAFLEELPVPAEPDNESVPSAEGPTEVVVEHPIPTVVNVPAGPRPVFGTPVPLDELAQLHKMVSGTKGYYTRDFSLGLGFNNVRYIIEAALAHAQILNRTAVLPSFIYARACEYNISVCAQYAEMVNKGDMVGWNQWRNQPIEKQMGFRIPLTLMLNVTRLRQYQPVLLVSEYLRLHGLPASTERNNGAWDATAYHKNANIYDKSGRKPELYKIENNWFDPTNVTRVDRLPQDMQERGRFVSDYQDASKGQRGIWGDIKPTPEYLLLEAGLVKGKSRLPWDQAREILEKERQTTINDEELELMLQDNGWEVMHTFDGVNGIEFGKTVINPLRMAVKRDSIRSFQHDWDVEADVVHLKGETHLNRKPGNVLFTTTAARDEFTRITLHGMHAPDVLLNLAERLDKRMAAKNNGRMWMSAHMRRGDFAELGWAMEKTIQGHLGRVKRRLDGGRAILGLLPELKLRSYAVPDVEVDRSILKLKPPKEGDKFYCATDERHPEDVKYLVDHGAVLIQDLLTIEDRREVGWPLMISDVLAVVEQNLLARSRYFYGHAMSSVAGGVSNMRAARGMDPRTELID